jgi:hypothetical protein
MSRKTKYSLRVRTTVGFRPAWRAPLRVHGQPFLCPCVTRCLAYAPSGSRIFRLKLRPALIRLGGLKHPLSHPPRENWGGSIMTPLEHLRTWTPSLSKPYALVLGTSVALQRADGLADGRSHCGKYFILSESRTDVCQRARDSRRLGYISYYCSIGIHFSRGADSQAKTGCSQILSSPRLC